MALDSSLPADTQHNLDQDEGSEDPFRHILSKDPSLPKFLDHSEESKYWHKPWEGSVSMLGLYGLEMVINSRRDAQRAALEGIIMIEEIGIEAISMLKKAFPDLDLHFIHRHVARSDPAEIGQLKIAHDIRIQMLLLRNGEPDYSSGLHFDGHCFRSTIDDRHRHDASKGNTDLGFSFVDPLTMVGRGYRNEVLVERDATWHRASTRISCCMLSPGLYLLLFDAPLNIPSVNIRDPANDPELPTLPRDPYDRPEWRGFNAYETLLRTFKSFPARDVLKLMSRQDSLVAQLEAKFHYLLNVSDWQSIIEDLERNLRRLQSRATESLEKKTLEDLGAFRRKVAATRESIADDEARMLVATGMATMRSVGRQNSQSHFTVINNVSPGATLNFSSVNRFGQAGSKEADTEALDAVALLDRLAQLEGRLGEAAKTVNEEIQLFIASVSIRDSEVMLADSKIMREDSQIMKQQAARTTLLTTLAVIYLPLQLITGIFGMNIQEITADGSLRWWACLAALGVGGVLTCLVYLAVKWWQWRRSQRKAREGEKEKEA